MEIADSHLIYRLDATNQIRICKEPKLIPTKPRVARPGIDPGTLSTRGEDQTTRQTIRYSFIWLIYLYKLVT